ncbi:MAG: DUF2079 domain-containing protein [Sandaracinaceae bacterium]|nr:DUF2079 domain-containing protein [Sandaracinaceae bacterium]
MAEASSIRARVLAVVDRTGASLRAGFRDDGSLTRRERRALALLVSVAALGFFVLAWQRYATFHNRNFDLAFYARLAWGEAHNDPWEPMVDAHVWGLHFVWPLELLGRVGALFGQVRTLLVAQSVAVAMAAWPLARLSARVLRRSAEAPGLARLAPWAGALGWLLQPNLWHVATSDFHPGTLAVLPLAWACESLERRSAQGFAWSALGVLACREDLGLVVVVLGLGFALRAHALPGPTRAARVRVGLASSAGALVYVALFLFVFHPHYAPANGSFVQHFDRWGHGPLDAMLAVVREPLEVAAWLAMPERAPYLLVVTAPLAFLAFLAPEWLVLAAPLLAMNLLSSFPTTLLSDSHYLTPALPMVTAASLVGASRVARFSPGLDRGVASPALVLAVTLAHVLHGGSPVSRRFDALAYAPDATTAALEAAVAVVPASASVQAPERVLAHFAERRTLRRPPPPETRADFVLFDAWRRRVDAHREELLRTEEEPLVRDWLARSDHALVVAADGVYLLEREGDRMHDLRMRHVVGVAGPTEGRALTACLALIDAQLERADEGATLVLTLGARGPCDSDLALRIGWGYRPRRVDLVAQGEGSPALFEAGQRIESRHVLSADELDALRRHGLRVGAIRQSGARPSPGDPVALDVPF